MDQEEQNQTGFSFEDIHGDNGNNNKLNNNNKKTKHKLSQQGTQQKQPLGHIDRIEAELNILDDDHMMSSPFRICRECDNDHSFKPNFESIKTSIEIISKSLSKDYCNIKTPSGS
jgi:hypothetical protein